MQMSDLYYRLLVESSPDGIILTDLHSTILLANLAVARLHGSSELLGRSVLDFVITEDRARFRGIVDKALHVGYVRNAECRLRRGDASFVAGIAIAVVPDEGGMPAGLAYVIRDMTKEKQREDQLQDQALHDSLTGLPNRVLFSDRLSQAIENARRAKTQVGVLYIDLDHFKEVNDSFGHDFADVLLQQTARRMQQLVRASDTLARLGGDEFAVVLPGTDMPGATVIATKLKAGLGTSFQIVDNSIDIGASIGIAAYPVHGDDAPSVLRQADAAMYFDKRSGSGSDVGEDARAHVGMPPRLPTYTSDVFAAQVDPRVLSVALAQRSPESARTTAE